MTPTPPRSNSSSRLLCPELLVRAALSYKRYGLRRCSAASERIKMHEQWVGDMLAVREKSCSATRKRELKHRVRGEQRHACVDAPSAGKAQVLATVCWAAARRLAPSSLAVISIPTSLA